MMIRVAIVAAAIVATTGELDHKLSGYLLAANGLASNLF